MFAMKFAPLCSLLAGLSLSASLGWAQPASEVETLRAALARTEKELSDTRAAAKQLATKNQQLEDVASARGQTLTVAQAELSAKVAALASERDNLALQLANERTANAKTKALVDKMAAERESLVEQINTQSSRPAAAAPAEDKQVQELTTRLAAAEQELVTLRAQATESRPATTESPAEPSPAEQNLQSQLTDTQEKLATALRSYTLLEQELNQTRTERDQAAAENATLRGQTVALGAAQQEAAQARQVGANATDEVAALREQLRQTQGEIARLAEENAHFRTKLALQPAPPSTTLSAPLRPAVASTPAQVRTSAVTTKSTPAAAPRQHVVAEGDTLGKIAKKYYGTADRWPEIYEANRDVLRNADRLPVSVTLRIP